MPGRIGGAAFQPRVSVATTVAQTTPGSGGVPLMVPPIADMPGAGPSKVTLYRSSALSGAKVVPPFVAS